MSPGYYTLLITLPFACLLLVGLWLSGAGQRRLRATRADEEEGR